MKKLIISTFILLIIVGCNNDLIKNDSLNVQIENNIPQAIEEIKIEKGTDPIIIETPNNEISQNYDEKNQVDINEEPKKENDIVDENITIIPVEDISTITADNKNYVKYPASLYALVNKKQCLPETYKPEKLVIPSVKFSFDGENEKKYMREDAAKALEELFKKAEDEGLYLYAVSGYRSYVRQKSIYQYNVNIKGETEANRVSAKPGHSEHQTGLAMDVSCKDVQFGLVQRFEGTKESQWLHKYAHEFGFIIRYPKGKEHITGYIYEPWHLRFLGIELATEVKNSDLTLEEFYENLLKNI